MNQSRRLLTTTITLVLASLACALGRSGPAPAASATSVGIPSATTTQSMPAATNTPTAAGNVSNPFGVIVGGKGDVPNISALLADLGAEWVRLDTHLDGDDPDFANFLGAGLNLIITFDNHGPANVDTTYGTLAEWPNAGFPSKPKVVYQQRLWDSLAPVLPYLARG